MKTMRWFTIAALVLGATAAHATNGMRMIGFGPVQESMGGATVGAPLDSATAITNPAGLSALPAQGNFGATYFSPDVKGSITMPTGQPAPNDTVTMGVDSKRPASPIPAVGVVAPLNGLTFGLGMWGIAGMGVDYPDLLGSGPALTSYSQMRFTPAVSYRVNDMVSVGLTLNGMWAQMEYNTGLTGPHTGASAFGVGAVAGVLVTPVKPLSIGLAYETKSVFQDFVFQVPGGEDKLTFDQPQAATLGVGYRPMDGLLLAADVQWINWSDTMGENMPKFSKATTAGAQGGWNMSWDDQIVYKIGAQFQATKELAVRVGYNYGKAPLDASRVIENVLFPAVAESHVTAGLSFALGQKVDLNLSGMYAPEVKLAGSGTVFVPDGAGGFNPVPMTYEVKMSQWDASLGLTFRM